MKTVLFENKKWKYNSEGFWHIYEKGLSNGQLWRMDGKCQEVRREGISFNFKDLVILKEGFDYNDKS